MIILLGIISIVSYAIFWGFVVPEGYAEQSNYIVKYLLFITPMLPALVIVILVELSDKIEEIRYRNYIKHNIEQK